jgi:pimeloyl-ACP methyl ester carboxylesterase
MRPDLNGSTSASPKPRWSLPRGRIVLRTSRSDPLQHYLVFVPRAGSIDAPVLVSVHGVSRNAHDQARVFASACDERGVVLLVPIFTPDRHRDYQRLGRRGRGERTDLALNDCLAEVALLTGADVAQFRLFGFSGGAQFAHRYLMAHPERVARAVFAAAGWYTFPDDQQRFPYGIRPTRALRGVTFNPERFLRVPINVLIGESDVESKRLRRTKRADAQQGTNRLERARNWVAALHAAADLYRIDSRASLTVVPGVDHSFDGFCRDGALVERVFAALFPPDAERKSNKSAGKLSDPRTDSVALVQTSSSEASHGELG